MDPILRRQLAQLPYRDPEDLLWSIMPTVVGILKRPEMVSHLTDKQRNRFLEQHQAGFLAFMMKHITDRHAKVSVCVTEQFDFDCVIRNEIGHETVYKLVQLKQLPSHETNDAIGLQTIVDNLKEKYPRSTDLVVAIWLNRDMNLDFTRLSFAGLMIDQLWFFGDAVTGELTLDGGPIAGLIRGLRCAGTIGAGIPAVRCVKFKPKSG